MKSICSSEPDVALTSIAATLGAALSSWGEQALVPMAGERGAGVSVAGHTPSGANTHSAGRGTPLAVMLWEPERRTVTHRNTNQRRGAKKGKKQRDSGMRKAVLCGREKSVCLSLSDRRENRVTEGGQGRV